MEPEDKPLIGVFTTSTELRVRIWDDAMTAMTGVAAADAIGKHVTELIPDIISRALLPRFEHVRDFGTTEVLSPALHRYLIPCTPVAPSPHFGEMRQLVTISALPSGGEIAELMVVVEDVTARMEHERDILEGLHSTDDGVRLHAAKAFSNSAQTLHFAEAEPLIKALSDKNWRVRRRLVDGWVKRSAPDSVAALVEAVRKDHFDFGMLSSALQILRATSIDTTAALLELLRSDDDDLRMQAALALGQQESEEVVGHLIEALQDENANVRYHVIEALGTLRALEAVDPLLAIAESRDFFLSFAALEALKQIGDPSAADRVMALLDDDVLREAAAATLGSIGDSGAIEKLVTLLNEGKLSVQVAAEALCALTDPQDAGDTGDRKVADLIRRTIGPGGTSLVLRDLDTVDSLGEQVVRLAGCLPGVEVIRKLAALLENDRLREPALNALVSQGEPAVPTLVKKLASDDEQLRLAVAKAIGSVGATSGVDALIDAIRSDPTVAPSALEGLGRSGSTEAFEALIELLSSPDATLRRAAANTLIRFPRPDMASRLHTLLSATDSHLRESAVRLAGGLNDPGSRSDLFAACEDPEALVRCAAIEQLRNFRDDQTIEVVARALDDESPNVRVAAAEALGSFEASRSAAALRRALDDHYPWVRYFAIRSLAANGGVAENRKLFQDVAERDPAEQVRVAAAEALGGS